MKTASGSMKPFALRDWIARRGLSHDTAAELLAVSLPTLRKRLYGVRPIGAQTARIVELLDRMDELTSQLTEFEHTHWARFE